MHRFLQMFETSMGAARTARSIYIVADVKGKPSEAPEASTAM
jgi:hypothetical protein